ncbi:MAG: glycosyltransferase family 61 protein [Pseudoalteromonas sp.]|jgi:hypothetical protein|nr:glycosyltransferase family 61 protein [Pseudoalteromonas sp.]
MSIFHQRTSNKEANLDYKNPVEKIVDAKATFRARDYLNVISDTDLSDTRMYNSKNVLFNSRYSKHESALLLPYRYNTHIPADRFFEHWAYDNSLSPIFIADHYKPILKGYRDHSLIPEYPFKNVGDIEFNAGQYYYMGMLNPHYGHFIQEAITRYWLALDKPSLNSTDTKFVFHPFANAPANLIDTLFSSGLGDFLKALGIAKHNIVLVDKPMIFESILIPESSIAISDGDCFLSDKARLVWKYVNAQMAGIPEQAQTKIYLSRAAVKKPIQGRVLLNEREVEDFFARSGFEIVIPEHLTQTQMQQKLRTAKVIAGNPGSGLQNSFFIPNSATTLGLTCKPIIQINPGLNHQVHTDIICGHKTYAYCSESFDVGERHIHWKIDLKDLNERLIKLAPEVLS